MNSDNWISNPDCLDEIKQSRLASRRSGSDSGSVWDSLATASVFSQKIMEQQIWKINLHCSMVHTSVKRLQLVLLH
uniref:Uncharacterized protein n=1 Tax=Anguilla anguilla TaxID=7936 RepID=A0A0E9T0P9_ANGAN